MNSRDVHDESTVTSLFCPLLDLLSNALPLVSLASNTIFDLLKLHVVPGYRFVEHEFLNLRVVQGSRRLFCILLRTNLDQIVDHRRFVWKLHDTSHQTGEEILLFVSRSVDEVFQGGLTCPRQFCRQHSSPALSKSGLFQKFACKSENLVQCACRHLVVQNISVTATLIRN